MKKSAPYSIKSISELHELFHLPKPHNPLISVADVSLFDYENNREVWKHFSQDFYCVSVKQGNKCKMRYGQRYYDFNEGVMIFTKPGQVFSVSETDAYQATGFALFFKADLIRNYPLGKSINQYGFFSYDLSEALHLSETEMNVVSALIQQIQQELKSNIDTFSQDIIVSHLDLLLNYANRFYNRQFITRKPASDEVLVRLENLLNDYFNENIVETGLPTVQFVAQQLNLSPDYLSDMLRSITGQTTQQHIHNKLIDKSKELLATTNLSVSEIAYQLGFEYPQSFNKLFKKKTDISPSEFRQSFN
ncbi:AraC family transcriptional regulator [Chryseobacterium sp. FH2]|uniref:helix-turn-helix domain-containing protein n=1 Tax=Chryseobacterium sp. FH2 TaxID=1674291 RepID=UPI00065AE925|nr:response regulator transcription factor [Chryseobacterium sp. FH2]KMQ68779.1 AraC family transcriptional regulator [Chryseobacterium sp. FH2]